MSRPRWWRVMPLAVLLLAVTSAVAFAKPRVAVLGLEVTGEVDQTSTTVARDLTDGLRARARGGNGPYALAPNSDRELIDEKLIKACDSEAPGCMSEIGRDLGADVLIYGKLERDGGGYRATLRVHDVKRKTRRREMTVDVPARASGDAVRALARKAYADLVGGAAPSGGTIVVTSNVGAGNVLIDDEVKDSLGSGSATIALAEGRYRLAIEADGYRRKEVTVTVRNGATTTESLELEALAQGGGGSFNVWKPVFGVSLAATLALAAYSTYAFRAMRNEGEAIRGTRISGRPGDITESDCDNPADIVEEPGPRHFQAACDHQSAHTITAYAAVGALIVTGVTGYLAFGRGEPREAAPAVAITPVLGPTGAGATLQLQW